MWQYRAGGSFTHPPTPSRQDASSGQAKWLSSLASLRFNCLLPSSLRRGQLFKYPAQGGDHLVHLFLADDEGRHEAEHLLLGAVQQ